MSRLGLCPPTTKIADYAYPESHPLRLNNHPISSRSSYLSEEYDSFTDNQYEDDSFHAYSRDEINRRAVALFDFQPENDNEVALREGQVIWISYRHGQGWLVAEDPDTGENGLVPEEYVEIFYTDDSDDVPKPFMPTILQELQQHEGDSEWEDTDDDGETDPTTENATTDQLNAQMQKIKLDKQE